MRTRQCAHLLCAQSHVHSRVKEIRPPVAAVEASKNGERERVRQVDLLKTDCAFHSPLRNNIVRRSQMRSTASARVDLRPLKVHCGVTVLIVFSLRARDGKISVSID